MTWVPTDLRAASERDAVLGLKPDVYSVFREILRVSWGITDPALLDLCRIRLAQLTRARVELAGVNAERLAELESWRSSRAFSRREQAALAFTEQYHLDHRSIADEQEQLARRASRRELVNFVWALHMNEAYIRALSLLDIDPDPPTAGPRAERAPAPPDHRSAPSRETGEEESSDLRDPVFSDVYQRLSRATVRQSLVDDVTSEAVRLHNANFQGCQY
jgi:hypothetical protein